MTCGVVDYPLKEESGAYSQRTSGCSQGALLLQVPLETKQVREVRSSIAGSKFKFNNATVGLAAVT